MEFDVDLTPDQWETLKALRKPVAQQRPAMGYVVEQLVLLGLVATTNGMHVITPAGRKVLIRGSSRLLDLAA
ncbi:MAG: hypothetical protein HY852_05935 [Bradyrhizobium sp.]|uniref:hypothetical protein n=1 Tax=Bradyrhizobium sp. TaxID=376 RepID=UPI0025BF0EFC|nr:hypothetical protein [Bradyrhizobium sp.]MBI5261344.1 hypothetical protein [Bradyrhizobium sp.]